MKTAGTVIESIEQNHRDSLRVLARELVEFPGGFCVLAGFPDAWLNSVFLTEPDRTRLPALVAGAIERLRPLKTPMIWDIGTLQDSPELSRALEACGMRLLSTTEGMALDLRNLVPDARGANVRIDPVRDPKSLRDWGSILDRAFGGDGGVPGGPFESFYGRSGLDPADPWQHYVASLDGAAVGAGSIFFGAGVVGIPCMGTLPEAGGRGVATALTRALLAEGARRGFDTAVLYSSDDAQPLYARIGFLPFGPRRQYRAS